MPQQNPNPHSLGKSLLSSVQEKNASSSLSAGIFLSWPEKQALAYLGLNICGWNDVSILQTTS